MSSPGYAWRCSVCDSQNEGDASVCTTCGTGALVTTSEISEQNKALGIAEHLAANQSTSHLPVGLTQRAYKVVALLTILHGLAPITIVANGSAQGNIPWPQVLFLFYCWPLWLVFLGNRGPNPRVGSLLPLAAAAVGVLALAPVAPSVFFITLTFLGATT